MSLDSKYVYLLGLPALCIVLLVFVAYRGTSGEELPPEPIVSVVPVEPEAAVLEELVEPQPEKPAPIELEFTTLPKMEGEVDDRRMLPFDHIDEQEFLAGLRAHYPENIYTVLDEVMVERMEHVIASHYDWFLSHDPAYLTEQRRRRGDQNVVPATQQEADEYARLLFPADVARIGFLTEPIVVQKGGLESLMKGESKRFSAAPDAVEMAIDALRQEGHDPDTTRFFRTQVLVKTQEGKYYWSRMFMRWDEAKMDFQVISHNRTHLVRPASDIAFLSIVGDE